MQLFVVQRNVLNTERLMAFTATQWNVISKTQHTLQHLMLMLVSVVMQITLPLNKVKHYTEQENFNLPLTEVKP